MILRPLMTEKGTHQSQHQSEKRKLDAGLLVRGQPVGDQGRDQGGGRGVVRRSRRQGAHAKPAGQARRYRFKMGRLSNWKKAIVTLQPDSPLIEFF